MQELKAYGVLATPATVWLIAYWLGGWIWLTVLVEATMAGLCAYCWVVCWPDIKAGVKGAYIWVREQREEDQLWRSKR